FARVGAAASRDEGDRAEAVVGAPGVNVPPDVNRFAVRVGLGIEVLDEGAWGGAHRLAGLVAERDALYALQPVRPPAFQGGYQLLQRLLALADDHHVRPGVQELVCVVRRLRPAQHYLRACGLAPAYHREHVQLGHKVRVDAHDGRPPVFDVAPELV